MLGAHFLSLNPDKNYEDLDEVVKKVLEKLANEGILSFNIAA